MDYNVPGVYVEEVSTLPPSVAGVATAIPAFVGYTEKALDKNGVALPTDEVAVKRIDTLLEYEQFFGNQPKHARFALEDGVLKRKAATGSSDAGELHSHLMYYALRMFFDNGGGSCYIVSVGRYAAAATTADAISAEDIQSGIDKLEEFDEPTLVVLPDAVNLADADYYASCVQVLNQCNDLKDRFGIFDVLSADTDASGFRQNIGNNHLKYGAAYTPYLQTSLSYQYDDADVDVGDAFFEYNSGANGFVVSYMASNAGGITPKIAVTNTADAGATTDFTVVEDGSTISLTIAAASDAQANNVLTDWAAFTGNTGGYSIALVGDGTKNVASKASANMTSPTRSLAEIKDSYTALYNEIKNSLREQRVVLPPSTAVAGIYSSVDRDRGVWKAPANVSITSLIAPTRTINNTQQGRLNVDATSGKSINVIRSFSGRGTLVWGARTLAGNDNEWRYVNVRRLFIYMQESIQKSTSFVVFEPNTATTWLKVKGLVESFLYGLWQQGALAGSTPESAYFVNVGLGKTMNSQDILEGKLIVEVGVAASRPAEFVILRFMHKLQES
ncbi:phage tail sheath C-terminal domain-containing protein [uncultured Microscilla sp.]|uniref:phage tail sheath family protein n=1 Tax=uncultured Microscilla sp. TaxID=432653 RepID=UPI00261D03B5|nr:phage tail sheath C-terminal domain-containing protein [uncultured Microscilla sp.]